MRDFVDRNTPRYRTERELTVDLFSSLVVARSDESVQEPTDTGTTTTYYKEGLVLGVLVRRAGNIIRCVQVLENRHLRGV